MKKYKFLSLLLLDYSCVHNDLTWTWGTWLGESGCPLVGKHPCKKELYWKTLSAQHLSEANACGLEWYWQGRGRTRQGFDTGRFGGRSVCVIEIFRACSVWLWRTLHAPNISLRKAWLRYSAWASLWVGGLCTLIFLKETWSLTLQVVHRNDWKINYQVLFCTKRLRGSGIYASWMFVY